MSRPDPDQAGFADAQDEKRAQLGSDVVFLQAPTVEWPEGTAINPATGDPYDPAIEPVSSAVSSASVRCGVFFKAINRGGADHAAVESEIGLDEHTRIFATVAIADAAKCESAVAMIFHGDRFKIVSVKRDQIITGYERILVYGAAEG